MPLLSNEEFENAGSGAGRRVLSNEEFENATPQPGFLQGAVDVAKGLGVGAAKGAEMLPGAGASLMGLAGQGLESLGIGDPEEAKKREQFREQNPLPTLTSGGFMGSPGLHGPESRPGKYGEAIGEFVPAAVAGGGSWFSRIATALFGGGGAEAAAELVGDPKAEPYAKIVGGTLGSFLPMALARTANPFPATQRHLADVAALQQEGVTDLTAGMRAGKRGIRYAEEHYGQSPLAGEDAEPRLRLPYEQFTRAALLRIGEVADNADPEVILRAGRRIGNTFDVLAARNQADLATPSGRQYFRDILQAQNDYDHLFVDPMRKPIVEHIVEHARNKVIRSNVMTGPEYQALRSRLERIRRGSKDVDVNQFIAEVRDAMDGLMERSIMQNNPADAGAWAEVRNQYRNLLAIERATTGAEAHGLISPAKLKQAAVGQNRRSYARGEGDFGQLARAGERVMGALPQSGTAPRQQYTSGIMKLLSTGIAGRAVMSPAGQALIGNQELNDLLRHLPSAKRSALTSILSQIPGLIGPSPQQPAPVAPATSPEKRASLNPDEGRVVSDVDERPIAGQQYAMMDDEEIRRRLSGSPKPIQMGGGSGRSVGAGGDLPLRGQIPKAEIKAQVQADRLRRNMGVEARTEGGRETDRVLKEIEKALKTPSNENLPSPQSIENAVRRKMENDPKYRALGEEPAYDPFTTKRIQKGSERGERELMDKLDKLPEKPTTADIYRAVTGKDPPPTRQDHINALVENVGNPKGLRSYAEKAGLTDEQVATLIRQTYDHKATADKAIEAYRATARTPPDWTKGGNVGLD